MFDPDAADFKDIKTWFNSKALSIRNFHGKVVLLDFWTYSCSNCINTLPHIKTLHEKYKDRGLVVIGVQTPEFEFEKEDENIQKAIDKYGITYPVANDHLNTTWKLYGNKYWPRKALINGRGKVVFEQIGEGGEHELEMKIIEALHEIGDRGEFFIEKDRVITKDDKVKVMNYRKMLTPEIYTGWERSEGFGNSAVCVPGSCSHYEDQGVRKDNMVYLHGEWSQDKERIHKENNEEGYAVLKYTAKKANAVITPFFGKKYRVYVTLDGR